ncbi:uncharacterized protein LOC111074258 [Drosophila obscura]|uniref:uncharacterized protein LOC111074258 n=1 Tax=Drosophila obscura TaxID=7282 RepID=UPI000B9FDF8C|nr:uncharacterized protein LOC111074258 [Drosophila obscura]
MPRLSDVDNRPETSSWRKKWFTLRLMTVYIGSLSTAVGVLAACLFLTAKGSHKESVKVFWTCSSIAYSVTSLLLIFAALNNRRYLFVPWVIFILMGLASYTMVFDWIFTSLTAALLLSMVINFVLLGVVIYQYRTLSRLSN